MMGFKEYEEWWTLFLFPILIFFSDELHEEHHEDDEYSSWFMEIFTFQLKKLK
jgi:hypothetical protein